MSVYGGIDLGGTKIQALVLGPRNKVLGSARMKTPTSGGPEDVAREMERAMRAAAEDAGIEVSELAGVGAGSPGVVRDGTVTSARNLPGWDGTFALADHLQKALGVPVKIGNDVGVALEAEVRHGAGRRYASLLGVFWGTGVGGGVAIDGERWVGRGGAGEIGHTVVELDGARCTCGRRGCMEAYAGRGAMEAHARKLVDRGQKTDLFKLMRKQDRDRLTSGIWARALEQGDELAEHMIERAVKAIAAAAASAVNLLDVEAVILGGGLGVRLGDPVAKRISKAMRPHLFADDRPPQVEVATLGDLGGAIGASLLVRPQSRARGARRAGARAGSSSA